MKPAPAAPRVTIVEDDAELGRLLTEYLTGQGMDVRLLSTAEGAERSILRSGPDLVVLDIMLPGGSGLDLCRALRMTWRGPILFLTALGDDTDVVVGLELGADDYIRKPVAPRVLLARIRALLRRASGDDGAETVLNGSLRIDVSSRKAMLGDAELDLTTTEFDLLTLLARRAGRVQERARLVEELRGIDFHSFDRSVDVVVSRLRAKLSLLPGGGDLIRTVRGVGYVLARDGDS